MYKIRKAEKLAENIFLMDVEAPRIAKSCEPGQFLIVKMDEKGERIPLTICDYHREDGTVTIAVSYTHLDDGGGRVSDPFDSRCAFRHRPGVQFRECGFYKMWDQYGCCEAFGRNCIKDGGIYKGAGFPGLREAGGILQQIGRAHV